MITIKKFDSGKESGGMSGKVTNGGTSDHNTRLKNLISG